MSDSKGGLCKDETLEIAGHRTGKVGKCRLSGVNTPTSSGELQKNFTQGSRCEQMYFPTIRGTGQIMVFLYSEGLHINHSLYK